MEPKVFAPQEPMKKDRETGRWVSKGLNLAPAWEFGDLIIMWSPEASTLTRELIEQEAARYAAAYDDREDWVLALGSPTLIAAFAHALGVAGKRLRILEWDRAERCYIPTLGITIP